MLRLRPRKDISFPINIFHSDEIRREIGESIPITILGDEYDENEFINGDTTKAIFSLNDKLANTKELGVIKKAKHNYITALLTIGIRIIKPNKKGQGS